jgi:hypothetical protein
VPITESERAQIEAEVEACIRSQIGRIGANTKWSKCEDRSAATAPARAALEKKIVDQIDPNRELTEAERAKRVECARKAYYQRMALKSAQVRRRRTDDAHRAGVA